MIHNYSHGFFFCFVCLFPAGSWVAQSDLHIPDPPASASRVLDCHAAPPRPSYVSTLSERLSNSLKVCQLVGEQTFKSKYNYSRITSIRHLLIQGTPARHSLASQYLHTYCPDDINASAEGHAQATHLATPSLTAVQVTQMVHLHDQIHEVEVLEKNLQIQTADETEKSFLGPLLPPANVWPLWKLAQRHSAQSGLLIYWECINKNSWCLLNLVALC